MNTLRTYLIACALIGSTLSVRAAEINPVFLKDSFNDIQRAIARSKYEAKQRAQQELILQHIYEQNKRDRKNHDYKAEQAERERKKRQEEEAARNRKRDQERKAAEDAKRREAEERKREEENKIRGFAMVCYKVHGQEGASCGLHAIDNGNKAYQCLIAHDSPEKIKAILLQPLSAAAASIPNKNMLDQLRVANIARFVLKMDSACFSILPNFIQSKDELLQPVLPMTYITDQIHIDKLGKAIEKLHTRARATHVFVINADAQIKPIDKADHSKGYICTDGHWLSIVADKKDGIITFHYMDTGDAAGRRDVVDALQAIIMRGNYRDMQRRGLRRR